MNHSPDPQLDTTSDAEEGFRNDLEAVFPRTEWEIEEPAEGHVFAQLVNNPEVTVERTAPTSNYYVTFGAIVGVDKTVKAAADRARASVSKAVRALKSAEMKAKP